MTKEIINKIFQKWALESSETREFLNKEAREIYEEEKETWWDNLEDEDKNYPKIWEESSLEYRMKAEKKLGIYLEKWWWYLMKNVSFDPLKGRLSDEFLYFLRGWLDFCCSDLDFNEISEMFIDEIYEKDRKGIVEIEIGDIVDIKI